MYANPNKVVASPLSASKVFCRVNCLRKISTMVAGQKISQPQLSIVAPSPGRGTVRWPGVTSDRQATRIINKIPSVTLSDPFTSMPRWRAIVTNSCSASAENTITTTGANQPAQWAAVTAYSDPKVEQEVLRMVAAFARRRDRVVARFRDDAPGVEFVEPHGAFYFFFRVDGIAPGQTLTGQGFCERLIQEKGVALVPGGAFGDDRWVRLSYAVSEGELDDALDRILGFVRKLGG